MNTKSDTIKKQQGAASLFTAVMLLIGVTLITLSTSKTVLMEQKVSANLYRTNQATTAANAAIDYAVAYFDTGGMDQVDADNDPFTFEIDYTSGNPYALTLNSADGNQTTTAQVFFDNNDGTCTTAADGKTALITAAGFSDDGLGMRTITQCVGTMDVFGGNGPKQPLISRGSVGLTGNYAVINRFTNITVWSGGVVDIGMSATAETFIRPAGTSINDYTRSQLEDDTTNNNYSRMISDRDNGNGLDAVASDPRLGNLTEDEFFNNFFFEDRSVMEQLAVDAGQRYTDTSQVDGKSGIIWVEGDATLNGGTIGSMAHPTIIIFNGNLRATGNPEIYGMLYVAGQLDAAGTVVVFGSAVVEGDTSMVPAGEDPVVGAGGVDLVYTPYTLDQSPNPLDGTTTVISGSWRDW